MIKRYLTLKGAAEYIGISYRTAREDWPKWTQFGVKPMRYLGKERGKLMFNVEELDGMMSKTTVIGG